MQEIIKTAAGAERLLIRARTIITMQAEKPVLDNGALLVTRQVDGLRLAAVGTWAELGSETAPVIDLGEATLAPGLINAHTHLEISHLKGKTTGGNGFVAWLKSLVPHLNQEPETESWSAALAEMRGCGTVFAADMADRHADRLAPFLEREQCAHWLMVQQFGFADRPHARKGKLWPPPTMAERKNPKIADRKNFCRAGHAFYSTAPDTLQAAKTWDHERQRPFALHLAEHAGETELLQTGRGELADFFRAAGILPDDFRPPGLSPTAYAEKLGLLDDSTLAVHCVHLDDRDIATLARHRVNVCLCPRSNAFIGVGKAPYERLARAGLNLCLGTDSLTSNSDLDLWKELEFLLGQSGFTILDALAMVTINPARALKIDPDYGSLESGKKACWSIVPDSFNLKP